MSCSIIDALLNREGEKVKSAILAAAIILIALAPAHAEIPHYCSVVVYDDFEDGDRNGWADNVICYSSGYSLDVVYSEFDASFVLKHEGGTVHGGGNCEAYLPGLVVTDCAIEADFRNVAAYHTTAKAMGLALRVNESTGIQYICWLTVAGDLFIYETESWTACGPEFEAHASIDPIAEGQAFHLSFAAIGDSLCVRVNGALKLTYVDPSPLPAGSAGVLATAGVTYFDSVYILDCDRPTAVEAATFGAIKAMYR
jgi:hypothetical protein